MTWSFLVYGVWFAVWVALELTGFYRRRTRAPWRTLSETAWWFTRRFKLARVIAAVGLGLLTVHIAAPGWP